LVILNCNFNKNSFGGDDLDGSKKFCFKLYSVKSVLQVGELGGDKGIIILLLILLICSWIILGLLYLYINSICIAKEKIKKIKNKK